MVETQKSPHWITYTGDDHEAVTEIHDTAARIAERIEEIFHGDAFADGTSWHTSEDSGSWDDLYDDMTPVAAA